MSHPPTLHTRKPVDQLRLLDIATFPVWGFLTDEESLPGQDETWVRPIEAQVVPQGADSLSVAAVFRTAAGQEFRGIVGMGVPGTPEVTHAAILTDEAYVFIPSPGYFGAGPSSEAAARRLGLVVQALFPLSYEVLVPVQGMPGPVRGEYAYAGD